MSRYKDEYKIIGEKVIDGYVYGYVKTYKAQVFYAIADGWEAICGVSTWVLVKKRNIKEKSFSNRYKSK